MTLRLYNTLSHTKEEFSPLDPSSIRLYVCGPTVYDFAHIGNARPQIVFDVLFRLLRHIYGDAHITYARNITDVDDKIMLRAAEEGVAISELTMRTARQFHEDVTALGCLPPTHEPRATEYIPAMIAMIRRLIDSGHAYAAERHVLFDVGSKPDYGKLARRSLDEMMAGARVEVAPYKMNPMDFVLWKPSSGDQPGWESPWGRGRPGWHIECSAMAESLLGDSFDIHGGGIDLVFPHHENEIAQSESVHHGAPLARTWMHNGFLQVEGEKMSKSLGNFVTIRELLDGWQVKGQFKTAWPGETLRFNMLRTHYRQPIDWTVQGLEESHKILNEWQDLIDSSPHSSHEPHPTILEALQDDLNTPNVIAALHALKNQGEADSLFGSLRFLGFSGERKNISRRVFLEARATAMSRGTAALSVEPPQNAAGVGPLSGKRGLGGKTPKVVQTPYGDINEESITSEIARRNVARKLKKFAEADRIRDALAEKGILLKDAPDGTTWEVKR